MVLLADDELKREPKNGIEGIDCSTVARVKGESAFCGGWRRLVAFVRA